MMIMTWESWSLFLVSCLMLNLAPGPDMVYILSRSIGYGRKVGFASATGVCTGALVHALAAALGLSAILATSATAFLVVKYVGAAYLVWLGAKALVSSSGSLGHIGEGTSQAKAPSVKGAFLQGALIDILNPKVALFFLAFLPQFISPSSNHVFSQTLVLGVIVVAIALVIEYLFVLAAAPLGAYLRNNKGLMTWLDRTFGAMLIALGAKLALTDR